MKNTAQGLISLLNSDDSRVLSYSIEELSKIVSTSWPLIIERIDRVFELSNNDSFPFRFQASKLVSMSCYYQGNFDIALEYALKSENSFDIHENSQFSEKIISFAIQKYIHCMSYCVSTTFSHRTLVEKCIKDLFDQGKLLQVICLSIECRLLSHVEMALKSRPSLVSNAIQIALGSVSDSQYRKELLLVLVEFSKDQCEEFRLSQLFYALEDSDSAAELLNYLCQTDDESKILLGYQIAFDLAENAHQEYRSKIIEKLPNCLDNVKTILTREFLLNQYMHFLFDRNYSDIHILVSLKDTFDTTKSFIHISVVLAYSYMYSGTADDNFFRTNTQWFTSARKWAQFTTAAALGAIHIGHLSDAINVLEHYITGDPPEHVLAGGLYALGLIYVNYIWKDNVIKIVTDRLRNSNSLVVQHGACLSLGLISMGSRNLGHCDLLRAILDKNRPEPGEAAGYALGMVMLGSGDKSMIDRLIKYANTTNSEKIMKGIAMGLGFIMYGREHQGNQLASELLSSRQPLLREGAAWITAMSYVGTSSSEALQRLLHIAVSDVSDHVRRAAVIGVGFVLSRRYKEVPSVLNLLAQSYHLHVRCGAALAIGIACAGTGFKDAIDVLKPLLEDSEDIVKQNAMMAMAMVMQQQSDARVPYAKEFRKYLRSMVSRKKSEIQSFGVCCAWGILNAGGRNVVISCNSLSGENSISATVGLALFSNHFFWHPLALMLPLSFHPTAIVGLDKDLNDVNWEMYSNEPKEFYSYPPPYESENPRVEIPLPVMLSISSKRAEPIIEQPLDLPEEDSPRDNHIIANKSRVTLSQIKSIDINYDRSYTPITGKVAHGFVMLKKNFQ